MGRAFGCDEFIPRVVGDRQDGSGAKHRTTASAQKRATRIRPYSSMATILTRWLESFRILLFILAAAAYSLAEAAISITTAIPIPNGIVASSYSLTFSQSGGTGSVTWSISDGALPPGLSLAQSGVLSGAPTNVGNFNFTVKVQDSSSNATKAFSIRVYDDDDGGVIEKLIAARPICTLAASRTNPVVSNTFTLTATCTQSPSSYVWSGPGIATGTSTNGTTPTYTPTPPCCHQQAMNTD